MRDVRLAVSDNICNHWGCHGFDMIGLNTRYKTTDRRYYQQTLNGNIFKDAVNSVKSLFAAPQLNLA